MSNSLWSKSKLLVMDESCLTVFNLLLCIYSLNRHMITNSLSSVASLTSIRHLIPFLIKLWEHLRSLGIHGHMLQAIKSMYNNVQCCVNTPSGPTATFSNTMGVKQGCPLSPTLFSLYIDKLEIRLIYKDLTVMHPYWSGYQPSILLMTPSCCPRQLTSTCHLIKCSSSAKCMASASLYPRQRS